VTVTGAQFQRDGTYVLRLTASDGALTAGDDVTITVNDNVAPPTVEITAPADGGNVTEPSVVTGSVSGGAWRLEYKSRQRRQHQQPHLDDVRFRQRSGIEWSTRHTRSHHDVNVCSPPSGGYR